MGAAAAGADDEGMPGRHRDDDPRDAIAVLVVDDHPALRDGLEGLLRVQDGFACVGALAGASQVARAVEARRPDVVILDYALAEGDGLSICFRLKQHRDAPAVVLYSAYVDPVFAVPATLAQADAIVSKAAPVDELLAAVRDVAAGRRRMPELSPESMSAAFSRLDATDLPIAGMLVSRVGVPDVAATLELDADDVRGRALRIIGELQARDREGDLSLR